MNFFTLEVDADGNDKWVFSQWLWIFFACTVPLTFICLVLFAMNLPIISTLVNWGEKLGMWRQQRKLQKRNKNPISPGQTHSLIAGIPATPEAQGPVQVEKKGGQAKTAQSSDLESGTGNGNRGV